MSLDPILQNVIDGLVMGQQTLAMSSPGMEPPRPMGCPNCAQAEAEVDRLKSALDLEAKARVAAAEMAHTAKLAQAQAEGDATAMLMLLAQIREACGDNGRRMQGPLVDYIRLLFEEADPDRVSAREAEIRAQDYAPAADPMDAGAWGEDKADAA